MRISIEPMVEKHWPDVAAIYREGIATGLATLETETPDHQEWNRAHLEVCRFVAIVNASVTGWAALSPISERCVYGGVAEVSVYVTESARGKGAGRALLDRLMEESEKEGIWTLQAGIFPENKISIDLHKSCGFREVGIRERLGQLRGRWRDVLLMERRSDVVGV
jgi:phosphinothricin acetyltransferase